MGDNLREIDHRRIAVAGGLIDYVTDPFGTIYEICNTEEQGFTLENR